MKCTSRKKRLVTAACLLTMLTSLLTGCGRLSYDMAYSTDSQISSFNVVSGQNTSKAVPFAETLCVITDNVSEGTDADLSAATAAALVSLTDREAIFAKDVHEALHPASLTKVMTALIALKYGSLEQKLTASSVVNITESGAQLCGLKVGDTMTLDQALRILLLYSANDAAMMIAEGVGGTVDQFIEMMNAEAKRLGATNTNFANPHGLTDANHYTTAYDLYLIFNEAMKYEAFTEMIQMTGYQTVYHDKNGREKEFDKPSTNLFIQGRYSAPGNVTVIGGKTGTTSAAGHCLMLLVRDVGGAPYISVVMGEPSTEELYNAVVELLDEINNVDK